MPPPIAKAPVVDEFAEAQAVTQQQVQSANVKKEQVKAPPPVVDEFAEAQATTQQQAKQKAPERPLAKNYAAKCSGCETSKETAKQSTQSSIKQETANLSRLVSKEQKSTEQGVKTQENAPQQKSPSANPRLDSPRSQVLASRQETRIPSKETAPRAEKNHQSSAQNSQAGPARPQPARQIAVESRLPQAHAQEKSAQPSQTASQSALARMKEIASRPSSDHKPSQRSAEQRPESTLKQQTLPSLAFKVRENASQAPLQKPPSSATLAHQRSVDPAKPAPQPAEKARPATATIAVTTSSSKTIQTLAASLSSIAGGGAGSSAKTMAMLVAMPAAVMARLQAGTASLVARGSIILSAVVQKAFSPLNAFTSKPLHQPFLLLQKPIIKIAEQTKQMAAWLGNGLQYPLKMIQGIKGTFSSWLGKLVKATMANGPQKAETEAAARYTGFWAKMRDKLKRKKKKPLTIVEDTHDDDVPETREPLAPIRAQLSWQKNPS